MHRKTSSGRVLANLLLDVGLTSAMLALLSFNLTGLALHEWLGLALCVVLPIHLVVHWPWLAAITRQLLGALPWRTRLTYLANASLFVSVTLVTVSGLLISEALLPGLVPLGNNRGFWRVLHTQASNASLLLVGVHLALYWKRVVAAIRRLATRPPQRAARLPSGRLVAVPLRTRIDEK